MIKIDHIEVFGWEGAIRGMRNPLNSWDKIDSEFGRYQWDRGYFSFGEADIALARKLCRAGSDHRKFLRQIMVSMDITAPLYWWKEFDTYKVGTVANSCSTMHTIHKNPFELDDFSHEHVLDSWADDDMVDYNDGEYLNTAEDVLEWVIYALNFYRGRYLETNDKRYWWQLIQLLPQSYNQRRTVTLNYEVLLNMYHARKAHKLDEWRELCSVIETLPYFADICLTEEKEKC